MLYTEQDVIDYVEHDDVKFIRLAFCDPFGVQKNISIMPSELRRAFDSGISFDASAVRGFGGEEKSDLFLRPDPTTLAVLPWRPSHGRVVRLFCDIYHPDGSRFALDSRWILRQAVELAAQKGVTCRIGAEFEFYLFKTDERGEPTNVPFDNAGYMDIAPEDRGENVRREICLTLENMGIAPERSHHEEGPGQNEIDFKYSEPLTAADNALTFKSVVRTIATINGLYASFMPKPLEDRSGNGMHINLSIDQAPEQKAAFMAGILTHVREITAFLNPTEQSYHRFGEKMAPKYITWSPENRTQLIRIPAASGEYARIELRSPDPMANPYLAYALLLCAGLDGMERGLTPEPPVNVNLYRADEEITRTLARLPGSYAEAIELAEKSAFVHSVLPKGLIDAYKH